ncbi:hypothetical protein GCM10010468_17180 [Actinocorallia longicatena]|uniref:Uncharacterized protein n=2 Tax=Actinocorallia longicatena TaxID=111803 RepID=A0ABP6Q4H7_9ACTN
MVAAGTVVGALTVGAGPAAAEGSGAAELCLRAQGQVANVHKAEFAAAGGTMTNVDYPDKASFEKSKPQVSPLTTGSYVTYEDEAGTLPEQIRCKGKTADHLQAVYGQAVAGPEQACSVVNAETLRQVAAGLSPAERAAARFRPENVVVDGDFPGFTGWDWLMDFPVAYVAWWDGKLHLPSKALSAPWSWVLLPESFRGQHYCTLVAPSHLKRLMLGQASV